jgi:cullin-associated NEDD8-dissociated protein 1
MAPLVDEMENWDKDKRFMAASDLAQQVQEAGSSLDVHWQKRVCAAYLKQIEDSSIDVQGNAVKCLGKIVQNFQDQQIGDVVAKLSQLVLDGRPEVRDIYATCLKGLFVELPASSGVLVCQNVFPKMHQGICTATAPEIKEECTEVLHDLLKRFGETRKLQMEDDTLGAALRALLHPESKQALKKKATSCIGVLAAVGTEWQLDTMLRALLNEVRERASNQTDRQTYIQCIGTISRNVGYRMGNHIDQVAPLLLQICKHATEDVSMDGGQDQEHEVVENALNAMESFVSRCSKDITPHFDELCTVLKALLAYDPNVYAMDDAGEDDDEFEADFDDDVVDSEDDDNSWKVRRSSLKVLSAMLHSMPERLGQLYDIFASIVVDRLKEREENVRLEVFTTFGEMVKATKLPGTEESREKTDPMIDKLFPTVAATLHKHLKATAQVKTRQGTLTLLAVLAEEVPSRLEPFVPKMLDDLVKSMKDSNSTIRLEALNIFLNIATQYNDAAIYQQIAPKVCEVWRNAMVDNYYKIAAQSFRVFGEFLSPLRPTADATAYDYVSVVKPCFTHLSTRLTATDIDQDVKEAALECFGKCCARCGDHPALQPEIEQCLPAFLDRFKNEVTRTPAIKALKTICKGFGKTPMSSILPTVCTQLTGFLRQQSRPFRHLCLDALVAVHARYGEEIELSVHQATLVQVAEYMTDDDLFVTDLCIQVVTSALESCPTCAASVLSDVYPKLLAVCRSPLLQGSCLDTVLVLLAKLTQTPGFETTAFKDLTDLSSLNPAQARHVVGNLAKCLARVVVNGTEASRTSAVNNFMTALRSPPGDSSLVHEHCVLTLGEIGKFVDLSSVAGMGDVFLAQLRSQNDEIRTAGALALGFASLGSMNTFLRLLIQELDSSDPTSKGRYLLLTSLRELITLGAQTNASGLQAHLDSILPILVQCSENEEEGVRNVVAECLGSLLLVDAARATAATLPLFEDAVLTKRATAASVLRHAAMKRCSAATLEPLCAPFRKTVSDESFVVRKAAVLSVSAVCLAPCCEILRAAAVEVLAQVQDNCKIVKDLIREVDLGPFKHKVDDGLPLRKFSYAAVSSLMAAFPLLATASVVDLVVAGLQDHEDVQSAACQILIELTTASPSSVLARIQDLMDPFDRGVAKCVKQTQQKQQMPKAEDTLRLYARTLVAVNLVSETDPRHPLSEMMTRWSKDAAFSQALQAVGREG